ncbi:MAG: hypothetical protein NTZ53_02700 [Cyanobacteria bacterium]|nr:hypothetical protein [Cyanobacteriota bacterium]
MTPRAIALLLLLALLGGCQAGSPLSPKGRQRCAAQVASEANSLLRPLRYGQCLLSIESVLERERAEAEIHKRAAERRKRAACYANQAEVKSLTQALKVTQERLARLRAAPYVESERPQRLDPDLQRRFASYDQELDQERYETALAQWQQGESQRHQSWQAERNHSISEEQGNLVTIGRRLNQINPALFAPPGAMGPPPVLNQQAYGQAIACQLEPLR